MKQYEAKIFNVPELKGISQRTIDEHMKLYQGYVKNTNLILEKIEVLSKDNDPSTALGASNAYASSELHRRFAFEFNGMRNHEYYFEQFMGGPSSMNSMMGESKLKLMIENEWSSFDKWLEQFKAMAMTRGVGWAVLWKDLDTGRPLNTWVDEQHVGQLNNCSFILGLDMWEHSFMLDYAPSEKKKYVEAFFENLNWPVVLKRFGEQ